MGNKKIKILSISKRDYRSEFSFPKKQNFFEFLRKFLSKLGFGDDEFDPVIKSIGRPFDKKTGEPIMNKEESIKKYVDVVDNYPDKSYSVDVIYLNNKIVLIINYKKDKQNEITGALKELIED